MGAIYTYNRGKFIFGKNSNEVNQAWQGQDNPTREVMVGNSTIWPSFSVGAVSNTFTFTPSVDSTKAKGDFTIVLKDGQSKYRATNKSIDESTYIEIDPAGGSGTIGIMTRESSLWHQLSLVGQIEETNADYAKIDNFTITAPSSVSAEVSKGNGINQNNGYTYTPFTLKVNSDDGKTTKLSRSQEHDVKYMPTGNYDILLNWSIKANNTPSVAYTTFKLNSFYDLLGRNYLIPDTNKLLFKVLQKSNISYYVNIAFLNETQGNNYILNTGEVETSDSITVDYNAETTTFYTFVELGISTDGGQNIYWNNDKKGSSIPYGISLNNELKLSVDKQTTLNYNVSVIEQEKIKPNLFKCRITSNANDELHNTDGMTQKYSIMAKQFTNTLGDIVGGSGQASFAESANGSTVSEKFKIGRSTTTLPISVNITASFNYGNYHI